MTESCPVSLSIGDHALTADGLVLLALLPTVFNITFTARDNSSITVNFERSKRLFSSYALSQPSTSRDKQICHFEGTDHGRRSWLSACDIERTIGLVQTPSNVFTLRTRGNTFEMGFGAHKSCGFGSAIAPTAVPDYYSHYKKAFEQRRYIELALFADQELCERYGTERSVNDRLHSLANLIQPFFKAVNIDFRLMFTEVWCDGDKATVFGEIDETRESFANYRKNVAQKRPHDIGILLVGRASHAGTKTGEICNSRSGAVVLDYGDRPQDVPWVMAHTLSLLFNVKNDDASCKCPATDVGCVQSGAGFYFSDCSMRSMHDFVTSGKAECLHNTPENKKSTEGFNEILTENATSSVIRTTTLESKEECVHCKEIWPLGSDYSIYKIGIPIVIIAIVLLMILIGTRRTIPAVPQSSPPYKTSQSLVNPTYALLFSEEDQNRYE